MPPPSEHAPRLDGRPLVAVFRSPVFNPSENFIQAQAAGLRRYQSLVLGLEDKSNAVAGLEGRIMVPRSARERLAIRLGRCGALAERVRPYAPVLVHAHFGTDGLLALPLARALGIPLVTTLRGYDVTRSRAAMLMSGHLSWARYALLKQGLMEGGDLFLAVSDALRDNAIAQGYPASRTLTHYNGVDLDRFAPEGGAAEPGLILHVGRLVEKKGTAVLLEAFAALKPRHPDAKLAIIGEGPLLGRLRRRSEGLGVADSVRFLGALPAEAVAGWMRRAWLLAAPSVTARDGDAEGLPNVVVEAAASGVPVVGSDHAGIPEAVIEGRTGFVVAEGQAAALAERMAGILASPGMRASMAAAARAMAEARFDGVRQTERLEAHYDRLAGVS